MKRTIFLILLLLLFMTMTTAQAQAQEIKINGGGMASGKAYIKTEIKGHKITIRTPKLSKNKYLKLVNVAL